MTLQATALLLSIVLIPCVAYARVRNEFWAFFVSAPISAAVLVGRMVYLEANAPTSDFDVIFGIACALWTMALFVGFAVCFTVAFIVRRYVLGLARSNGSNPRP